MIALPGQLFYTTQIPACLWFLARNKGNGKFRDRRGETLFIDARKLGHADRPDHSELTDDEIGRDRPDLSRLAGRARGRALRGRAGLLQERDARRDRGHGFVLTPGRYVGAEDVEDDGEPFEEKMGRLVGHAGGAVRPMAPSRDAIRKQLAGVRYGSLSGALAPRNGDVTFPRRVRPKRPSAMT